VPSRAIARQLAAGVRADDADLMPGALACFEDDFKHFIAQLRLRLRIGASSEPHNLLGRLFVEERRRLKIVPNGSRRETVLKLMFGAPSAPPSAGTARAPPSSSSVNSRPSGMNSTRNTRLRPCRWRGYPYTRVSSKPAP
jgi:hypothetical protein